MLSIASRSHVHRGLQDCQFRSAASKSALRASRIAATSCAVAIGGATGRVPGSAGRLGAIRSVLACVRVAVVIVAWRFQILCESDLEESSAEPRSH